MLINYILSNPLHIPLSFSVWRCVCLLRIEDAPIDIFYYLVFLIAFKAPRICKCHRGPGWCEWFLVLLSQQGLTPGSPLAVHQIPNQSSPGEHWAPLVSTAVWRAGSGAVETTQYRVHTISAFSDSSVQFLLHLCIFSNALRFSFSCQFICFQPFTFFKWCACLYCLLYLDFWTQFKSLHLI